MVQFSWSAIVVVTACAVSSLVGARVAPADSPKPTEPMVRANDDAALKDFDSGKYRAALERLEAAYHSFRMNGTQISRYPRSKRQVEGHLEVCASGDSLSFVETAAGASPTGKRGGAHAVVSTPRRSFSLWREEKDREYMVESLLAHGSENLRSEAIHKAKLCRAPFSIGALPVRRLMDPAFKITRVTRVQDAGKGMLRIDWTRDVTEGMKAGWLLVDPGAGWVLHAFEVEIAGEPTILGRGSCEYDPAPQSVPVPRRATLRWESPRGDPFEIYELRIDEIQFEEIPDSEFTLTAFGIQAFGGDASGRLPPIFVWSSIGVLVALAILLLYRARERLAAK